MSHLRVQHGALFVGAALLATAIFVPWLTLTTAVFGLPSIQQVSPGSVIWNAIFNTPVIVRSSPLVVGSLLYLGAALAVVGLSIPIVQGARQQDPRVAQLAGALIAGAVECGVFGLVGWLALPFMLEFFNPYPDASPTLGILLALAGSALAIMGLTAIAVSAHRR